MFLVKKLPLLIVLISLWAKPIFAKQPAPSSDQSKKESSGLVIATPTDQDQGASDKDASVANTSASKKRTPDKASFTENFYLKLAQAVLQPFKNRFESSADVKAACLEAVVDDIKCCHALLANPQKLPYYKVSVSYAMIKPNFCESYYLLRGYDCPIDYDHNKPLVFKDSTEQSIDECQWSATQLRNMIDGEMVVFAWDSQQAQMISTICTEACNTRNVDSDRLKYKLEASEAIHFLTALKTVLEAS